MAETIGDLEKCRHLYLKQIEINKEYKQEVLLIQNKMEENKADYDAKMLEYAQLLDVRAAKIKVAIYNRANQNSYNLFYTYMLFINKEIGSTNERYLVWNKTS